MPPPFLKNRSDTYGPPCMLRLFVVKIFLVVAPIQRLAAGWAVANMDKLAVIQAKEVSVAGCLTVFAVMIQITTVAPMDFPVVLLAVVLILRVFVVKTASIVAPMDSNVMTNPAVLGHTLCIC